MLIRTILTQFFVISSLGEPPSKDLEFRPLKRLAKEKDWWQSASFYQIYPRSFKDSNGDGIGDLNGITEKLPYLKGLGIDAFWLSPIFKSPMADFGYDIADFFDIQPEYGTMEDFDALVKRAKELGLKIILDFVPNHSSDENEWFIKSANREPEFEDFYVWHPGKPNPKDPDHPLPPSNWISIFMGSAWKWHEGRKEYYLHQFHYKQPDLNYRNPKVVEKMKSVLNFWLDRGVDGFRIDAVPHLFEVKPDADGNYPDEPKSGNPVDPNDPAYLDHIYTQNQNETLDMVYQWRAVLDEYRKAHGGDTRIMMTEAYTSMDTLMRYYGNGTVEGSHIPFNFEIITQLHKDSTAGDFKRIIDSWMSSMPRGRTANWVMGNHDQNRVSTRMGEERIDLMNTILLTLPGACITYNGEEIGMTDVWISWNDTVDPAACNTNPSVYEKYSRDPERTPFQWDSSTSAGFSTNPKTWLPISPNYAQVNVALQEKAARSHLKIFKDLIQLRQNQTFRDGELRTQVASDDVLVIIRELEGAGSFITLANLATNSEKAVDLTPLGRMPAKLTFEIVGVTSKHTKGEQVATSAITLQPNEAAVLYGRVSPDEWAAYFNYEHVKGEQKRSQK